VPAGWFYAKVAFESAMSHGAQLAMNFLAMLY
jgi:hypothetical protein